MINAARAFAVRRVESAVGHLHAGAYQSPPEYGGVEAIELTADTAQSAGKGPGDTERGRHAATVVGRDHGPPDEAIGSAKHATPAGSRKTSTRTHRRPRTRPTCSLPMQLGPSTQTPRRPLS